MLAAEGRLGALATHLHAHLRAIDEDAERARAGRGERFDPGPLTACVVGTLCLVFMEYAREAPLVGWLEAALPALVRTRFDALLELAGWVAIRIAGFALLPALAIRLCLRERIRDHGLAPIRARDLGPYLGIFVVVLPCLCLVSFRPDFAAYYPFYKLAHASWLDLVAWELMYALHFVALEFFFRGFWVSACRESFGSRAALVSAVPYCMIHFTKPLLEVIAALPAGIVLGLLALRARSIWGGALLHVAVAVTMDVLALLQTSGLPRRLFP